MGQGAPHVLVDPGVARVEDVVLLGQHVHGETVLGHELVLLSCREDRHTSNQRFRSTFLVPPAERSMNLPNLPHSLSS